MRTWQVERRKRTRHLIELGGLVVKAGLAELLEGTNAVSGSITIKWKATGAKLTDKFYHQHTGYVGNLKSIVLGKLLAEHPERAIEFAVKGMLPKGPLGRRMFRKLHVFGGKDHTHQAQQPKALEIQEF